MINPYQAPTEDCISATPDGTLTAEFQLTERQIRFAESKFLLHRCGGRLTLASLAMIALAIAVAFDLPGFPSAGANTEWYHLSLVFRELVVMGLAAAVYLSITRSVTRKIRKQLQSHGMVSGVDLKAQVHQGQISWTSPYGHFSVPLAQARLNNVSKGLIIAVDADEFWFVPRHAAFSTDSYRNFVRGVMKLRVNSLTA